MSFLESIFLGLLQGISEFLPISSSGHLAVAKYFLNLSEVPILYDILLHIATLLAVCLVYRKRIFRLICTFFRLILRKTTAEDAADVSFIIAIIIATFFTGLLGVLFKDIVKNLPLIVISVFFVLTGIVLLFSDKVAENKEKSEKVSIFSSMVVGIVQGLAVFPGISRSGSTLTAGLFTNIKRSNVAEFSFILSIPAILGALVLELAGSSGEALLQAVPVPQLVVGFMVSFVTGLVALKLLTKLLQKARLKVFSFYLIPLGLFLFFYLSFVGK